MTIDAAGADNPGRIGDFEVLDDCGTDGPFQLYRAKQAQLDRRVYLKVVPLNATDTDRLSALLFREAEATAQIDHPGVLRVVESGTANGRGYLALSFVDSETLVERIRRGSIPDRQAADYTRQLAETLFVVQSMGQVHANLRPEYVHIGRDGQVRLSGFGTFDRLDDLSGYMPPERLSGPSAGADVRCDIYGVGALLYAMLTGRAPLRAEDAAALEHKIRKVTPRPPSEIRKDIHRDLEAIRLKCLSKNPLRRYGASNPITQLIADLRRFLNRKPVSARSAGAWERMWLAVRRQRRVVAATAFVGLGVTAVIGWDWYQARSAWAAIATADAPADERVKANAYWLREVTIRPHDPEIAAAGALAQVRSGRPSEAMKLLPIVVEKSVSGRPDELPTVRYLGRESRWRSVHLQIWALAALNLGHVDQSRIAVELSRSVRSDDGQPEIADQLENEVRARLPPRKR